jgi:predicted transposase/invertase (TIGR01784 family)
MMSFKKFLDPKNDYAFKKIFGTEKNKDILIHFLNDLIAFPGNGKIQNVTFLKTTQEAETAAQKTSLVDILCQDEKGHYYIVEMQVAKDKGFAKRAQYDASRVYTSQMQAGQKFHELKEVIFLAVVDFTMFPEKKSYKSDHVILDKQSHEHDLQDFSFTFIELPKFTKEIDQLCSATEKWVYFFKNAPETSEDELQKLIGTDSIIEKAYQELNALRWNQAELLTYDDAELQDKVYHGALEQKYDEGFDQGFGKGLDQGLDKGKEVEREKIIITMLQQDIDDKTICTCTHIPLETLRLLKERISSRTRA